MIIGYFGTLGCAQWSEQYSVAIREFVRMLRDNDIYQVSFKFAGKGEYGVRFERHPSFWV